MLDQFERGMKTAEVQVIFDELRPKQVELIKAISEAPQVEDAFLLQAYDEKKMWDFSVQIATQFGYDWERGRQDKAAHPFTTEFSINDVRITTRFEEDKPLGMLFSTMHEVGHALYELGSDQSFERTPLAGGTSLAVHESQSRLWENLVGRSMPFWEFFFHRFRDLYPEHTGDIDLQKFYRGINLNGPALTIDVRPVPTGPSTKML